MYSTHQNHYIYSNQAAQKLNINQDTPKKVYFLSSVTHQNLKYQANQHSDHAQIHQNKLKRCMTTFNQNRFVPQSTKRKIPIEFKENIVPSEIKIIPYPLKTVDNNKKNAPLSNCYYQNSFNHPQQIRKISIAPFQLFEGTKRKEITEKNSEKIVMKIDDFVNIKHLGKGKFGVVSLVRHKKTNFICALKTVSKKVVKEQKVQHQISRELRIHNTLKHLNIIGFYGFFDDQDNIYILTEYATGGELYSKLKECRRMPEEAIVPIIKQTAEGLKMIHNLGFIHRDLKPENLVMQFDNIKICDLGWAVNCSFLEMRKSTCGTPLYYSPQIVKKQQYNGKTDIWSLGLLTYELAVGRVPFKIWSQFDLHFILQQQVSFPDYIDLSQVCKNFILECLCKDQSKRIKLQDLRNHTFLNQQTSSSFNLSIYNDYNLL